MLTPTEHLLSCLSEECAEVAWRVSKALRFGIGEVQPGQDLTNAERIEAELHDLFTIAMMLKERGVISLSAPEVHRRPKRVKVEHFMRYAISVGAMESDPLLPKEGTSL